MRLELFAPPGCPSREAIVAQVDRLLTAEALRSVDVTARIRQRDGRWELSIELGGGRREVVGASCAEVAEVLAVVVALAIDPNAEIAAASGEPLAARVAGAAGPASGGGQGGPAGAPAPPVPAVEAAPVPEPARPAPVRTPPPAPPRGPAAEWHQDAAGPREGRWGASALALGEVGALPAPSLGARVALRADLDVATLEASLGGLGEQRAELPGEPNKGGDLWWWAAQAQGCRRFAAKVPALGCAGLEAGELRGRGFGAAQNTTARALWVAPVLSVVARGRLVRSLGLEARLGVSVPVNRPVFGLDPYGGFFQPSWASARVELGIGVN